MKSKKLIVLCGLVVSLFVLTSFTEDFGSANESVLSQEGLVVYAIYDGHEDYGYNFVTKGKDDVEYTLTFQKVNSAVLKAFDLSSDTFVGNKFKITFNKEIKVVKDEDGNDDEDEINTITNLEKL